MWINIYDKKISNWPAFSNFGLFLFVFHRVFHSSKSNLLFLGFLQAFQVSGKDDSTTRIVTNGLEIMVTRELLHLVYREETLQ